MHADRNEIVAVAEVPFAASGVDRDGVIEPTIVSTALDTLIVRLGITDRSQARVGLTIGPRNAGVGSGPAMISWLKAQAARLRQPFVCSGGLGIAFVPIRAVDQAVKTAFDIGLDLHRVDLAPVAAVRAVGEQIDDVVCLGSGRGWQARMRDFEVLEAMENPQIGVDEPVCIVGPGRSEVVSRYGWIDLSVDLLESGQVDIARMAAATGAAVGVLYESPANLLSGKVIGAPAAAPRPIARAERPVEPGFRPEPTLQLNAVQVPDRRPAGPAGPAVLPPAQTTQRLTGAVHRLPHRSDDGAVATAPAPVHRPVEGRPERNGIAEDDPINLFSPENDESTMLGSRFSSGFVTLLVLLVVVAVGLGAAYLFV